MPEITELMLITQQDQPAIMVSKTIKVSELPSLIQHKFAALKEYTSKNNLNISDIPYVAYHSMNPENLKVDIIFPVLQIPEGEGIGDILHTVILSRKCAFQMYLGDYDGITPVYEKALAWLASNGYEFSGTACETYYNNTCKSSERLTKILFVLN